MSTKKVYRYSADFKLTRRQHEFLEQLMQDDPITLALEAERELASRALDGIAAELAARDEERRKHWGNKFPMVAGQLPPPPPKPEPKPAALQNTSKNGEEQAKKRPRGRPKVEKGVAGSV